MIGDLGFGIIIMGFGVLFISLAAQIHNWSGSNTVLFIGLFIVFIGIVMCFLDVCISKEEVRS